MKVAHTFFLSVIKFFFFFYQNLSIYILHLVEVFCSVYHFKVFYSKITEIQLVLIHISLSYFGNHFPSGERGGSVVECRTPEREVRGSRPTSAVLCPWARHFTPRKYWLITQEAMAPSRHDWKIVDWDVKPQHNQPTIFPLSEIQKCFTNQATLLF